MPLPKLLSAILATASLHGGSVAAQQASPAPSPMVSVSARVVLLDRAQSQRAGIRWLQAGGGRIVVRDGRHGRGEGVGISTEVPGIPVSAFIELARDRKTLRSESRMQVTTVSGSTASVSSGTLSLGRWGTARETGPELVVTPTVLADGSVQLQVRARLRDEVTGVYGARADGSPVDAATTVVVRPGEEATVANVSTAGERRDAGLLRWESATRSVDALVVLTVSVAGR